MGKEIPQNILSFVKDNAFEWAQATPKDFEFSPAVVSACKQNVCGRYGSTWNCPPAVGEIDALKERYLSYSDALVITTKSALEDSFDIESMDSARQNHTKLTDKILSLFRAEGIEVAALGAGSCTRCQKCTYPGAPCRMPEETYPSVEAVGIDVVMLSRTLGLHYFNGVNTVTYFSVLLYK